MPIVLTDTIPDLGYPLLLATTLNSLAAGLLTVPEAEAILRYDHRPHHVLDLDGQWNLGRDASVPLRVALARSDQARTPWALLLPTPGQLAGLRGPAEVNSAALQRGAVVVRHDGGPALVCDQVGYGVQWTLMAAERPLLPEDPRSAGRTLLTRMTQATQELRGTQVAAARPQDGAPILPRCYPAASQALLDRAFLIVNAADAAADASRQATTSHQMVTRERALQPLERAAKDAISSAVSWPGYALTD